LLSISLEITCLGLQWQRRKVERSRVLWGQEAGGRREEGGGRIAVRSGVRRGEDHGLGGRKRR